jgi:hypothetical protein
VSSFVSHLLILYGVIVFVVAALWTVRRAGLQLGALPYAGVFGFVGAAFGVVIGLSTFFANQHYANFRAAAQSEATGLGNISALTGSFSRAQGDEMRAQLYCYATDVIDREWPNMGRDGRPSLVVEAREAAGYLVLLRVGRGPTNPAGWYTSALGTSLHVAQDRQRRLLLSEPQIPDAMWALIYVGAGLIVLFTFFFHLKSRWQLAGMFMAVLIMLTAIVGVLSALDSPAEAPLALAPDAMIRERNLLTFTLHSPPASPAAFCRGVPLPRLGETAYSSSAR